MKLNQTTYDDYTTNILFIRSALHLHYKPMLISHGCHEETHWSAIPVTKQNEIQPKKYPTRKIIYCDYQTESWFWL